MKRSSRQTIANGLITLLPQRLAEQWIAKLGIDTNARFAALPDSAVLRDVATSLKHWELTPSGTEGYRKAEVTRGGVATDELSQTTFEARRVAGVVFYRRGRRRHRLAGRLQLSVGVGVGLRVGPGRFKALGNTAKVIGYPILIG